MADMTPDPGSQDASGATDTGAQPGDDGQNQNGFTIAIVVDGQGKIAVGVLPGTDADQDGDDDANQAGAQDGDHDFVPAKNIKDALTIALDAFRNGGELGEQGDPDGDLTAGFTS